MNDGADGVALQDFYVGEAAVFVGHGFAVAAVGAAFVPDFEEFVGVPLVVAGDPCGHVVEALPEDEFGGRFIEADDDVTVGANLPQAVPGVFVLEAGVVGAEFSRAGRAGGHFGEGQRIAGRDCDGGVVLRDFLIVARAVGEAELVEQPVE